MSPGGALRCRRGNQDVRLEWPRRLQESLEYSGGVMSVGCDW